MISNFGQQKFKLCGPKSNQRIPVLSLHFFFWKTWMFSVILKTKWQSVDIENSLGNMCLWCTCFAIAILWISTPLAKIKKPSPEENMPRAAWQEPCTTPEKQKTAGTYDFSMNDVFSHSPSTGRRLPLLWSCTTSLHVEASELLPKKQDCGQWWGWAPDGWSHWRLPETTSQDGEGGLGIENLELSSFLDRIWICKLCNLLLRLHQKLLIIEL